MARPLSNPVSFERVKEFLLNFNIEPHPQLQALTFKQLHTVIKAANRWHGLLFAAVVRECFAPVGKHVEPGEEYYKARWQFTPVSWDEIQNKLTIL